MCAWLRSDDFEANKIADKAKTKAWNDQMEFRRLS